MEDETRAYSKVHIIGALSIFAAVMSGTRSIGLMILVSALVFLTFIFDRNVDDP